MDQMTQSNAAMAEEVTASSRSLSEDSEKLVHLIGQFSLDGGAKLRADLQKVAPHAFREAPARPAASPARPAPVSAPATRPQPKPTPAPRAAASARSAALAPADDDWREF
jgi:methyl-accepting chemotaxis protein